MTKEQFIKSWSGRSDLFKKDLDAVIAHEIAKAQEVKLEDAQPQPAINPIERAYERGDKIRCKNWLKNAWIQKLSETESTSDTLTTFANNWDFEYFPEKWEIYTDPAAQPSSQAKLDNSFDKDRFEAMFRAVVASGDVASTDFFSCTIDLITKLDAFYASKEGGNNG